MSRKQDEYETCKLAITRLNMEIESFKKLRAKLDRFIKEHIEKKEDYKQRLAALRKLK